MELAVLQNICKKLLEEHCSELWLISRNILYPQYERQNNTNRSYVKYSTNKVGSYNICTILTIIVTKMMPPAQLKRLYVSK